MSAPEHAPVGPGSPDEEAPSGAGVGGSARTDRGGRLVLVTGGARSGKSAFAERLAARGREPVVYLATARVWDEEMGRRVDHHRAARPASWSTIEAPTQLGAALRRGAALGHGAARAGTVLLDDVGNLVANLLFEVTGGAEPDADTAERLDVAVAAEVDALDLARRAGGWDLVVVTNEVGLGIVPATPVGRVFRDALGRANQGLAARSDAVFLLVAGQPLRIKPACPACAGEDWP